MSETQHNFLPAAVEADRLAVEFVGYLADSVKELLEDGPRMASEFIWGTLKNKETAHRLLKLLHDMGVIEVQSGQVGKVKTIYSIPGWKPVVHKECKGYTLISWAKEPEDVYEFRSSPEGTFTQKTDLIVDALWLQTPEVEL